MGGTVLNSIFLSMEAIWGGVNAKPLIVAPTYQGFIVIPNNNRFTITITNVTFTTTKFRAPGSQFPITVNPGQSAIIEIDYIPTASGGSNLILDTATIVQSAGMGAIIPLFVTATGEFGIFPSSLVFPTTQVGQSVLYNNYVIVNTSQNAAITVNTIGMVTGTDFFLVGAPIAPFVIPALGVTAPFSIQFTPTTTQTRSDFLRVVLSDTTSIQANVQGVGTTLQSAFNLTGLTSAALFAFPNIVLQAQPTNSAGCEEPSSAQKLHDFNITVTEKELLRVRGHYEDLGPATFSITAVTRRTGQPDAIVSTTVKVGQFNDGWIREFIADINTTGELIQLTISQANSSGPVSIIDYIPELVLKGEVLGGTGSTQ